MNKADKKRLANNAILIVKLEKMMRLTARRKSIGLRMYVPNK